MSLSSRLDEIRDAFAARDVPVQVRRALDEHVDRLVAERAAERALGVGGAAPAVVFQGVKESRSPLHLDAELPNGPLVLTWFRGDW